MIRILHVVTFMGMGGLETMLMNYYRHIDRSKIQFDFLVHRDFRADYDDEIESYGGKIFRLPRLNPLSKKYKKDLNSFFKQHREYRVVHVHQDCLSSIILKVAKCNGVPIRIAHSHINDVNIDAKYPIKLYYKRQIPKYATHLMACSDAAGRFMFKNEMFSILKNPINTQNFKFSESKYRRMRSEFFIDDDTLTIGHVGRFEPAKNHTLIIDIFEKILARKENARLVLVGDGYLRKSIELYAKSKGIHSSIIFTGKRSDIPDLLNAMDVFLMPSLYEGLGIACIEAQANGLPCIISDSVSKDCDITDLVTRLSLSDSVDIWAKTVIESETKDRFVYCDRVIGKGYDVNENAKILTDFYLKVWN